MINYNANTGIVEVTARDLPDLWFQAVRACLDHGARFKIDKGSYQGDTRLEFEYFMGHIHLPMFGEGTPMILPEIPPALGIPNPVDFDYVYGGEGYERSYIEYLMTGVKQPGESYTYGERLTRYPVTGDKLKWFQQKNEDIIDRKSVNGQWLFVEGNMLFINQIEWIISTYKNEGYRNNQMVLQVAHPSDLLLKDPPCLRQIDTRIQDNKLRFFVYFRSWDLWGGLPANLAAIQALKSYMASEIGVEDGDMIVESKGLHLYSYAEDLAKIRTMCETANCDS